MNKYGRLSNYSVTAVIPTYNEEKCIKDCILSLKGQSIPLEIIVVDDGSTDDTVPICEALGVRVLRQRHRGPGAARNLGVRNATGNILVLIDADMTFAPNYVEKLIELIIAGDAIATCHWNERVANWANPWARCQTWFEGRTDRMRQPLRIFQYERIYRAVRRDFFLASGGFAENEGRGDDSSIAKRTGVLATIVQDAFCYHQNVSSLKEAYREALWHGRNIAVSKEYRIRRSLVVIILRRNLILETFRGILLALVKKEPRVIPFSIFYTLGFVFGVIDGLYRKYYLK